MAPGEALGASDDGTAVEGRRALARRSPELANRVIPMLYAQKAQTLYRKAFNGAWDQYGESGKRRRGSSREETAHRVAWSAVKRSFEKRGDRWVRAPSACPP